MTASSHDTCKTHRELDADGLIQGNLHRNRQHARARHVVRGRRLDGTPAGRSRCAVLGAGNALVSHFTGTHTSWGVHFTEFEVAHNHEMRLPACRCPGAEAVGGSGAPGSVPDD